jgi:DNA-binding MarR family transcriptional regulator/GNAT superfamily N-acetyltransferase
MSEALHQRVEAIRRFNRFYTQKIGALEEGLLHSPFTLGEVRVLYELAHREQPTATELANELALDAGQLSRILRGFEKSKLIARKPSPADNRQSLLTLTELGRRTFAPLNERAREEIVALLKSISVSEQNRLVEAMHTVTELLDGRAAEPGEPAYILRPHQPGDMGWVVHRHGVLYAQEYGWDERFEALVAGIVAEFIQNFDARRERCWIAERAGEIVGSVFLVQKSKTVAKLRLLLVEPSARGLGIGARLVDECVRFARRAGYRSLTLWTQSVLSAARHIYERAGFRLVQETRHNRFGPHLVGENWELKLRPSR